MFKINAHIHLPPNFSAFTSVEQAVEMAAKEGVAVLGASNYYDYDVYEDFARLCRQHNIYPLYGLEVIALLEDLQRQGVKINDPGNPGKMYLCGKGITKFNPLNPRATELLSVIRRNDSARMAKVVAKLGEVFAAAGFDLKLDENAVIDRIVKRHGCPRSRVYLQERHVCQAFQEVLFERVSAEGRSAALTKILGAAPRSIEPVTVQNEIRAHLLKSGKPAYVPETFVDFAHARDLILALGGIPCYPVLADGVQPICGYEETPAKLIERLQAAGITMAEFIPLRNSPAVLGEYAKALRAAGIAVTAGTEHNTLDLVPITPTCAKGEPIPEEVRRLFEEGAVAIVAHQERRAAGLAGFVDEAGQPDMEYATADQRIAAFAEIGARAVKQIRNEDVR